MVVVEGSRGVGDTRSRETDDEERAVAELLRDADPTRVRIVRAVAVLGPAATAGRVAAVLDAEVAEPVVAPLEVSGAEQEAASRLVEATGSVASSVEAGGPGLAGSSGSAGAGKPDTRRDAGVTGRVTASFGSAATGLPASSLDNGIPGRAEGPLEPGEAGKPDTRRDAGVTGRVTASLGSAAAGLPGSPLTVAAAGRAAALVGLKAAGRVVKPLTVAGLGGVQAPVGPKAAEIPGVLAELATTGLFDGERCTDPAIAARILRDLPAEERRELHGRAARVLYSNGFPPTVVATHLVATGDSRATWAANVLIAAADDAVGEDQLTWAAKYLDLAYRTSSRARERAAIATRLVSIEWRVNPSGRTRNFGRLRAAVNAGLIPHPDIPAAVLYLLWHGCAQHADRALTRLERSATPAGPRIDFLCAWLQYTHPTHVERHQSLLADSPRTGGYPPVDRDLPSTLGEHNGGTCGGVNESAERDSRLLADRSYDAEYQPVAPDSWSLSEMSHGGRLVPAQPHERLSAGTGGGEYAPVEWGSPYRQASELLTALSARRPPTEIATAAQRLLSGHRLTLGAVEPLVAAIDCLIHADRLDLADAWCASLLAEAAARHAPTWQSIFAAVRAEILLRKGNLADAAENAVRALNLVPAEHLGVWSGRPIGVLVRALTAQGKHSEAAAQLRRPVPRAMFESRFALAYLTACGEHCLATDRPEEALRHFRQCGNLMRQWRLDFAWLTPWRNDVAAAYLAAGRPREARAFASMHLDSIGGANGHRSGGVSLRLLAATSDPHRRVSLLRRAVATARAGDDELELAAALGDLGRAYRSIGDADRARPLLREAIRLAELAGAELLLRRLRGGRSQAATVPLPRVPVTPNIFETLSPAERRVAELAAVGQRNRDIAAALDITTSTVEQHLTKVYRKLSVARRGELRFVLAAYLESTRSAVG